MKNRRPPVPLADDQKIPVRGPGAVLRDLREGRGASLRATARAIDSPPSQLSRTELGRNAPSLPSLWRLSVALGLTDEEIARVVRACGEVVVVTGEDTS